MAGSAAGSAAGSPYTPAQLASAAKWAWGQCTYYAGLFFNIPWQGDADTWATESQWPKSGFDSSAPAMPAAGDIVVFQPGVLGADSGTGHVAVVTAVNPTGTFNVSEMNWGGQLNTVHTRQNLPVQQGETFIVPPASADVAAPPGGGYTLDAKGDVIAAPNQDPGGFNPLDPFGGVIGGITGGVVNDITSGITSAIESVLATIAKPLESTVIRLMIGALGAVLVVVALHMLAGSAERDAGVTPVAVPSPTRAAEHVAEDPEAVAAAA